MLRLPTNCIHTEGGKSYVMLVTSTLKDGKPVETETKREVVIGLRGDDYVEIVSGLKEKDGCVPIRSRVPFARRSISICGGPGGLRR